VELKNLDFEILILNSIELLGCLNHVITITLQIRYTGCYSPYRYEQHSHVDSDTTSLMPSLLPLTPDREYGSALHDALVASRSMISLGLLALRHLLA
jgi:hypothetical protein